MTRHLSILLAAVVLGALALAPAAEAGKTKAIWGQYRNASNQPCPNCSVFPTYRALGVDVYQFQIQWDKVARRPPANPRNPNDPAYKWPRHYDFIVSEAARYGIGLAAMLNRSPAWANGGRSPEWAPNSKAFGDFAHAASLRYPSVSQWMIWGEPDKWQTFMPQHRKKSPRRYAKLLQAAYKGLKSARRSNKVIGGMTLSGGTVKPPVFIRNMKLKKGKRPRMDYYGHNPFDRRFPRLKGKPRGKHRGLNDIDTLWKEIKAAYAGQKKKRRPRKLWLSEWTVQTDQPSVVFDAFVTRAEQARRITAAYRMVRRLKYVKALGYFSIYDYQPAPGNPMWGLITYNGVRKPGYYAYARVP